jgi:hypothetical protein
MRSLFKRKLTVDQAAEELYTIMGKDDKAKWLSQLSKVPEIDPVRAEDELYFLDFFAIYFSLKFTRSPGWSDKGILVFEKFFSLFLSWLGHFWESKNAGTTDDAFKTLDARLEAYGARINEPSSVDPEKMLRAIGETFAIYTFLDDTYQGIDGRLREDRFLAFQRKLSLDHDEIAIKVGGAAFNYRIQSLYEVFDSSKLR